jgi:hypothetical protein
MERSLTEIIPSTVSTATAPVTNTQPKIPIKLVGSKGSNPIPIFEKLWDFFSLKGIKTVLISLGTSSSPLAELEIAETLGCPLHIVEYNSEKLDNWNKVTEILKNRKESDETRCSFTSEVINKWVLPKNIRISNKLPHFFTGSIELSGNVIETINLNSYVESICSAMNISTENARVDLLNIQLGDELEQSLLYSFLNNCYRPGFIIVNYTYNPDSHLLSTMVAGHLQNVGYTLIGTENSKFLYVFNDKNAYEYCSYEQKHVENPLIEEIIKATRISSFKK